MPNPVVNKSAPPKVYVESQDPNFG